MPRPGPSRENRRLLAENGERYNSGKLKEYSKDQVDYSKKMEKHWTRPQRMEAKRVGSSGRRNNERPVRPGSRSSSSGS